MAKITLKTLAGRMFRRGDRCKDFTQAWPHVDRILCEDARRNFAGNRLVRTGRLRDSLTEPGHPDHVARPSRVSLQWGTQVEYAVYHQRRGRLQLRPTTEGVKRAAQALAKHVVTGDVREVDP